MARLDFEKITTYTHSNGVTSAYLGAREWMTGKYHQINLIPESISWLNKKEPTRAIIDYIKRKVDTLQPINAEYIDMKAVEKIKGMNFGLVKAKHGMAAGVRVPIPEATYLYSPNNRALYPLQHLIGSAYKP